MIRSFGSTSTEQIWHGEMAKALPTEIQQIARRKLRMIHNAQSLQDMKIAPGNRLEKLKGTLKGFHSIRINDKWRIIFIWKSVDAFDVEITDYHG